MENSIPKSVEVGIAPLLSLGLLLLLLLTKLSLLRTIFVV